MKRSLDYLLEDFGVHPLSVIIGGGGWSKAYPNHSARIAAQAGFGLFDINERYFYLDRDLALDMAGISPGATRQYDRELKPEKWPAHPDGPYVLLFHDRDISLQHDFVERTFQALPKGVKTISMNQYVGILHTRIDSLPDAFGLRFQYDEPYCAYFKDHSSSWRLPLADWYLERTRRTAAMSVAVDGRPVKTINTSELPDRPIVIQIPAGMGSHIWMLEPK